MDRIARPLRAATLAVIAALMSFSPLANATRNILFIAIDDMRVDTQAMTPNIDTLAATSTRYTNAYAAVPVCVGSRTTVITGLKPSTHRVGLTVFNMNGYNELFADPNTPTLPGALSANGYYTATMGKITHNAQPDLWDHLEPYPELSTLYNPVDPGPDGTYFQYGVLPPEETHPDQATADWASDFLQTYAGSEPFFLAVGFFQPHLPWYLPQWAYDLYPAPTFHTPASDDLNDEPTQAKELANAFLWNGVPQHILVTNAGKSQDITRAYLAAISHTDTMVGQVLYALANSDYADNTDIVLWSDHGFHLGEKFHWRKATFWQPAVKVPLLIKSPAIPAGDVTDAVSLLDLAPTVLDLAGAPAEPRFEGVSLVSGRSPVEIFYGQGKATVSGGMKSIDYDPNTPGTSDVALYDLVSDPLEQVNITPPPPVGCG